MHRKIFSILTALALCLSLMPGTAWAEEVPTRTDRLDLFSMSEATGNAAEGWKWEPSTSTLTLTNCYIKMDSALIIRFPNSEVANLVLEGDNIIETSSTSYNYIIGSESGQMKLLKVSGSGSLTVTETTPGITPSQAPYIFASQALTIEDGASIYSNMQMCIINKDFTLDGGSVTLKGEYVDCGIYVYAGDVIIKNGYLDISGGRFCMFLPGIPATPRTSNVKISGGTVNLQANVAAVYSAHGSSQTDSTDNLEITGGDVQITSPLHVRKINVTEDANLTLNTENGLVINSGYNIGAALAGGTYTGSTAAIQIADGVSLTLADLLASDCAIFKADGTGVDRTLTSTGPGTFTVGKCDHAGAKGTSNNNGTHSINCPYCGYTGSAACTYGEYEHDDTNHWRACTVCGHRKDEEAHTWLFGSPIIKGNTTTNYKECVTCQHKGDYVDVTITLPDNLTYGSTEGVTPGYTTNPAQTFTSIGWKLYVWTDAHEQTPVKMEDGKLPAGLPAGKCYLRFDGGLEDSTSLEGVIEFTVSPASLSGTPTFGSGEGKTLGEVDVTLPEGWPAGGTFAWETGDSTQVVQGTSYAYTYTSPDGNYAASGSVILWAPPPTPGGDNTGGNSSWSSGSGSSSGTNAPSQPSSLPVTTTGQSGAAQTTTTTAAPSASTGGGTASAAVDSAMGAEIVRQAVNNNSESVVIAPGVTGSVTRTEVSIPADTVGQIGARTGASLTVSTQVAAVTIPNGGLGSLSGAGGTVVVSAEKTGNAVTLSVTAGGRTVERVPGGVTLTVPAQTTPGTVAVLVRADGTREVVRKSVSDGDSVTIPLEGSARMELVDNSRRFSDVPAGSWMADAAAFVSARELFGGTGADRFDPDLPMSRGMLAVVLHNLENNPEASYTGVFPDVDGQKWYAGGVAWAAERGIVSGYSNGLFGPDDSITREQLAVMLWRYAGSPASALEQLPFSDADRASGYARDALRWAVESGILSGSGGRLDPRGIATRAQAAQMLANFLKK